MDQPNYILHTNEAVLTPVEQNTRTKVIKNILWVMIGIIVVGSILLGTNLFAELSGTARVVFISLVLSCIVAGYKKEYTPSPMQLQFYDDRLVLYLPKRYYNKRATRKVFNQMKYADITKCVYKAKSQRVHIYGKGNLTWYDYRADGTLTEAPTKVNDHNEGLIYFSTRLAPEVDFVKEIETHSPLKVEIKND